MKIHETSAEDAIVTYPSSQNTYHWLGTTAANPVRAVDSDLEKVLISYPVDADKNVRTKKKRLRHLKHVDEFFSS